MGTNYWYDELPPPPCLCCKRPFKQQKLHIGKSSYGWYFALHVIPELGINELINWIPLFAKPGSYILDENKQFISASDMIEIITCRSAGKTGAAARAAEIVSNNLTRHKISHHCVGHGATWDLILGDFS